MISPRRDIKIGAGRIWRFFGGLKRTAAGTGAKPASGMAIEELRLPALITLPVDRHLGRGGRILVSVGEKVKRGQALTVPDGRLVPLHASTSGTVISIAPQILPHPSGYTGLCISIRPDGNDEAVDPKPLANWKNLSADALLLRLREYGIEGLGGAMFQTAAKLGAALRDSPPPGCYMFIVNGCECEPDVSCDDRLMREHAEDICLGIRIITHILRPRRVVIAIEDDKPEAISAMRAAAGDSAEIRVIPARYPSGAARSLIRILTGLEIPYGVHTSSCGLVVDNVGTVYAVKQAVADGLPLTSRVVTVTGGSLERSGNVRVRLGTSVRFVLNNFRLNPEFRQRIVMGGPMMGFTLPSIDVPITKGTNCLFVPNTAQTGSRPEPSNCIRCGRCARVCPSRLVPYRIYALSRGSNHAAARRAGVMDCTGCGCCGYTCPSRIDLTMQFRREQAIQKLIMQTEKRNTAAIERAAEHTRREEEDRQRKARLKALALQKAKAHGKAGAAVPGPDDNQTGPLGMPPAPAGIPADSLREDTGIATASEQDLTAAPETLMPAPGTSAADEGQSAAAAGSALPYALRLSASIKKIPRLPRWDHFPDRVPDLSVVGRPPGPAPAQESTAVPQSDPPRALTYAGKEYRTVKLWTPQTTAKS